MTLIISIHPPLAGRDDVIRRRHPVYDISIHPPLAGRDSEGGTKMSESLFQSTRPLRGGTRPTSSKSRISRNFNPPAPCGAGPLSSKTACGARTNFNPPAPCGAGRRPDSNRDLSRDFNPPAPCGAGPDGAVCGIFWCLFQSTRPLRGGTVAADLRRCRMGISIHPPLAGRD